MSGAGAQTHMQNNFESHEGPEKIETNEVATGRESGPGLSEGVFRNWDLEIEALVKMGWELRVSAAGGAAPEADGVTRLVLMRAGGQGKALTKQGSLGW